MPLCDAPHQGRRGVLLKYPYRPEAERNCMVSGRELPVPTIRVPKVNENVEVKFNNDVSCASPHSIVDLGFVGYRFGVRLDDD